LVGHFGTFGAGIASILRATLPTLLRRESDITLLLIGVASVGFRDRFIREFPDLADRVHSTGGIEAAESLSLHLSACDVLVQPYPDGVTTRRGTIMAALSHGRPTITTQGAFTEPFWQASGAVVLAPAGDSDALVEATLPVLKSAGTRVALGEAGKEFYQRCFDVERVVGSLRELD
jgi:glycosyltransferase involved in cell wall biosynthesis